MVIMQKIFLKNKGAATIELLIAFAILIINITAVMLLVGGGQSVYVDSELNTEAVTKTKELLEKARALSRVDFSTISECDDSGPDPCAGAITSPYTRKLTILNPADCSEDVQTTTSWSMHGRNLDIDLVTHLTDIITARGGDCNEPPEDDWLDPQTFDAEDIVPGGNKGTDIDVVKIDGHKYAFLTSVHSAAASDDFWVFDLETSPPSIIGRLDTGPGLNAVDVARAPDGNYYAYVANNNTIPPYEQLIVIDLTNLTLPAEVPGSRRSLPGVAGADPAGRAIYFYDDKIFIGTRLTAGNEFNIYDVSDPGDPSFPSFEGQREINHSIRKITVKGIYAYLATTADKNEIIRLDVSDPTTILPPWGGVGSTDPGFDADGPTSGENGQSVFILGDKIILGRARATGTNSDLFVLKTSDFAINGKVKLDMTPSGAAVEDITAVGSFIFLGTSDSNSEFQVWKVNDLSSLWSDFNFPQAITGIEFLDDKVYASVDSNDALHIIYDAP